MIFSYYEAEMRYLREAGKEFASAFPDRARELGLDRLGERDPHVERLFEGFAFLMGRLRQKLDDELPELTEGLVSMLWPHYLRMIPSLSILEIQPTPGVLQVSEQVPAGLEVLSDPIAHNAMPGNSDRIECIYRTTQAVDLYPLQLSHAQLTTREDGRSMLRFRFVIDAQARRGELSVPRLRLYLHADRPLALSLYSALTATPLALQLRIPGYPEHQRGAPIPMPDLRFEPAGFAASERLWPKPDNAFGGYQLLLEYFTFPEKFMFVDLLGLDLQAMPAHLNSFELELVLQKSAPTNVRIQADNFRLFCTPAINLFNLEADTITTTAFDTEYRVRAHERHGTHVEVYAVDAVQGLEAGSGQRFEYAPFAAFRHRGGMLRHSMPERYFHTRMRRGPSGYFDTWVVLGGQAWDQADSLPSETLSLSVTGTNGMLPRKALREASITRMRGAFSNVGAVRNLMAPTLPVYPPTADRFHWRVLSHLAPNYLSLLDAQRLRGALALYDWTDGELNRRRIAAITQVTHQPVHKLERGCVLRGVAIELTLDGHAFAGPGDIELFGAMINRFLGLYATVNLFTRLTVLVQPGDQRLIWPDTKGDGAPL